MCRYKMILVFRAELGPLPNLWRDWHRPLADAADLPECVNNDVIGLSGSMWAHCAVAQQENTRHAGENR